MLGVQQEMSYECDCAECREIEAERAKYKVCKQCGGKRKWMFGLNAPTGYICGDCLINEGG